MQYVLPSLLLTKQSSKQQKKTIKREYKLPIEAYLTGQLISEHFLGFLARWAKLRENLLATLCQNKQNKTLYKLTAALQNLGNPLGGAGLQILMQPENLFGKNKVSNSGNGNFVLPSTT